MSRSSSLPRTPENASMRLLGIVLSMVAGPLASKTFAQPPFPQTGPAAQRTQAIQGTAASSRTQVTSVPINPIQSGDGLLEEERTNIYVYEKCNRSVVHISTKSVAMDSFLQVKVREGGGSGSIIDKNGLILTNQHVVDGARQVTVSLHNGLSYPAELVGEDPDTDIAVLRIDAPKEQLVPIEWGDSTKLRVGQRIYAIGNPFGLERSLSAGMISSLDRQIPSKKRRTMFSLIQIDATINQGNSGGPLLNTRGQLIGMNTAILSSDGDSAGVGFAIPASTMARITPELVQHGRFIRPAIGITRVYENDRGLLIVDTLPGGPADQAGLQGFQVRTKVYQQGNYRYSQQVLDTSSADLIIAVDNKPVQTSDDLLQIIESRKPGDTINVSIERNNQRVNVPVVLGKSS